MTRRVAMLAYPEVQMLDVMGPLEVFARTSRWLRDKRKADRDAYRIEILGLKRGVFRASSGLRLHADRRFGEVRRGLDTLLIAGGVGTRKYYAHPPLLRWIRRQAGWVRRLASVCTGSFFLAEAGLLKGRRATPHWGWGARMARLYPEGQLEPGTIFVRGGPNFTPAGVAARPDPALGPRRGGPRREVAGRG